MRKKVIQFGAGNIGRGFLGQLFNQSGYEVVFVDVVPEIVSSLNKKGFYRLKIVGDSPQDLIIDNVRAVNAKDEEEVAKEIISAHLLATAVGARNLASVASLIAQGVERRARERIDESLNLIICENIPEASKVMGDYLAEKIDPACLQYLKEHLGLVEAVVSRMVPVIPDELRREDPTFIMAEEYSVLPVDRKGFKGEVPEVKGIIPYDNLPAYEEQKLFTHNTGHAVSAYLGYQKGYGYIWESINDDAIRAVVEDALLNTGQALIKRHGFRQEDQQSLVKDLLHRFGNRALGDTVVRVGRDPVRKLRPEDRLVGAARLTQEYGTSPVSICQGIAAAIFFDYEGDEEAMKLTRMRKSEGVDSVLQNICRISPEDELSRLIKIYIKGDRFIFTGGPNNEGGGS